MEGAAVIFTGQPWYQDGHKIVNWDSAAKRLLFRTKNLLQAAVNPRLSRFCTHTKNNFGAKGAVRWLQRKLSGFNFVARFDVDSYYQTMRHDVLLSIITELRVEEVTQSIVRQYLTAPDTDKSGVGMVAGGALSPLLGALYLLPLDKVMELCMRNQKIFYIRYMDDIIILSKTRWHLRMAIKTLYAVIQPLGLQMHRQEKYFIGRIEKGFDFLGYHFYPYRKLRPSVESLRRLVERARRLYEQGNDINRLRQYVSRWTSWLWGGLLGMVTTAGGTKRYFVYVLKQLQITGVTTTKLSGL